LAQYAERKKALCNVKEEENKGQVFWIGEFGVCRTGGRNMECQ